MEAGTVKVGRWAYPALRDGESATRNTKRDGSGDWEETNPALFAVNGSGDPAAEAVAEKEASKRRHPAGKASEPNLAVVPPIDGFVAEKPATGAKAGAQPAKPGKSTWEVGTKCPKGHTLTDADGDNEVYAMPSGRKQCRLCRRGYGSNGG